MSGERELRSVHGLLGLAMVGGSLLLCAWAIYHLMRTGSCASGGVYVSARPCPAGTGSHVLGLLGSIFLALAGTFVARSVALGVLWFGMFFTVIGAAALLVAWGPAAPPDDQSGGVVMGIVFIVIMGIPPMLVALSVGARSRS